MPFQNKALSKNALAWCCALTLLFSYAEMILPRVVPFFRLGLANTVILLALDIKFSSFFILSILKATAASLMGGTLFSPFFLISIMQSILSALVMRLLHKIISKKVISLYGISIAGSAVSAFVQITLAALYIGSGTFSLLGPMLIFNTISGIITAFFSEKICVVLKESEFLKNNEARAAIQNDEVSKVSEPRPAAQIALALTLIAFSASVFFLKDLRVLGGALLVSLIAQRFLFKRNIFFWPHLSLWLFVFISAAFVPNGKVLCKLWNLSLTKGALLLALQKALTLSTVSALSQCAVCLKPGKNTLLGQSLQYYKLMSDSFLKTQGSIIKKIKAALNLSAVQEL